MVNNGAISPFQTRCSVPRLGRHGCRVFALKQPEINGCYFLDISGSADVQCKCSENLSFFNSFFLVSLEKQP